jgi:hypothetical protein
MKITIDTKFPKLSRGNDCDGRVIRSDAGERVGAIFREVEWTDTGVLEPSYGKVKVTGYRLEIWDLLVVSPDVVYETLAEATAAARAHFAKVTT